MWNKYKKFATGTVGMFTSVIVLSTTLILGWRWGVTPTLKRRRRDQNEAFAEFIYQERQAKVGDNIHQQ